MNLSVFKDGKWIWKGQSRPPPTSPGFEFERLTHSYVVPESSLESTTELPIPFNLSLHSQDFVFHSYTFEISFVAILVISFIANFAVICYNGFKATKIPKDDTKIVRRWLKISFSSGKQNKQKMYNSDIKK